MEKKRRARINNCLNELKTLILEALKKDVSIYSFLLCIQSKVSAAPQLLQKGPTQKSISPYTVR